MERQSIKILLSICLLFIVACGQTDKATQSVPKLQKTVEQEKLIPIDYRDSNYADLSFYAKDTITKDGWSIKYLVKDDSTRYSDLYIEWSKGKSKGLYRADEVLQLRRSFIPLFNGEMDSFLIFTQACATECRAILVLDKNNPGNSKTYMDVFDYNLELGQILYVSDETSEKENEYYVLYLVDLNKRKEYKVAFDLPCMPENKLACIDAVVFGKDKVTIKTYFEESANNEKEVHSVKTINLKE